MKKLVWVMVADSSRARLLGTDDPAGALEELEDMLHQDGRSREGELVSDRPGRNRNGSSSGSHSIGHEQDAKKHEMVAFAKDIGRRLVQSRQKGEFERLYLMASEKMLGLIKKELDDETTRALEQADALNLVQHSVESIRDHLPHRI